MGCIPSPKFRVIHRSLAFEAIKEKDLLKQILEALEAKKVKKPAPKEIESKVGGENEEEAGTSQEGKKKDPEAIEKIVSSLARLEQSHMEQNKILVSVNQELNNEGIAKVCRMEDKIRSLKEALGAEEKEEMNLLDRPNPAGSTLLHASSTLEDGATTRLLLKHGANPNLQDADGNSPLHIVCGNKDIQTATCILKMKGSLLTNKRLQTPAIEELLFDQSAEEVDELMKAVDESNHRKEFLDKILEKKHTIFRLVEEDKPEILSIVMKRLKEAEQERYVNLVRDKKDQNSALHVAVLTPKSLECTSMLLEAGAKFKTNAMDLIPKIEDFFTEENENQITPALVDGLVRKVKANQLDKKVALKLIIPDDEGQKILFQLAKKSNWETIAEWAKEEGVNFKSIVPRMSVSDLEKMVEVGQEGIWEKEKVHSLLCQKNDEGAVILSRLEPKTQQAVAVWDEKNTNQIAHEMSTDFIWWLVQEAKKGNWDSDRLGEAFCQLDSNGNLKLATVADEELQKQLAVLNKEKTCLSAPLLCSNIQQWMYQEAVEGQWDSDLVFRVLQRKETEGGEVVSSTVEHLGIKTLSESVKR